MNDEIIRRKLILIESLSFSFFSFFFHIWRKFDTPNVSFYLPTEKYFLQKFTPSSTRQINPLSANPTKLPNTPRQFVGNLPMNCLTVFDYFAKLAFKGLRLLISKNIWHNFAEKYSKISVFLAMLIQLWGITCLRTIISRNS